MKLKDEKFVAFKTLLLMERARKRMTIRELSEISDVSSTSITHIESGKVDQCLTTTALKICQALDVVEEFNEIVNCD